MYRNVYIALGGWWGRDEEEKGRPRETLRVHWKAPRKENAAFKDSLVGEEHGFVPVLCKSEHCFLCRADWSVDCERQTGAKDGAFWEQAEMCLQGLSSSYEAKLHHV
ncbi:hypothetical protein INR49_016302 [Caranx melampygus]|nr:hypothetical protein INR49_016302 [Caranx melampygus]